jgi:hypothetical protein
VIRPLIRVARISDAGVTAGTTVDGISGYSRRIRECQSEAWFPGMRRRPVSGEAGLKTGGYVRESGRLEGGPHD